MRSLGGEVGELAMTVPGSPHLREGERALFFLRPSTLPGPAPTWLKPLGMSQGVFRIQESKLEGHGRGTSSVIVLPGAQGLRLLKPGPSGELLDARPALSRPEPLQELRLQVEGFLNTKKVSDR